MSTRIPYPFKGLNENWAAADQPPLTTRREVNMVVIDPVTGQTRGAQRAGSTLWCPEPVAEGEPIREIINVKAPTDNLEFEELETPTAEWSEATESGLEVHMVRGDDLENTYWLEQPNRITKRNRDGRLVWSISVPANKIKQFCKVLEVDPFGTVYVAVTSSSDPTDGRLWAYQVPADETEPEMLYEAPLSGFVRHMVWKGALLYLAVNRDASYEAAVQVFAGADTVTPTLIREWRVPYPCNALAIKDDGSVFATSPPFPARAENPDLGDGTGQSAVDWLPSDLPDFEQRCWGWWDSTDVFGVGGKNETLEDGDRVETWYSKVGPRLLRSKNSGGNQRALGAELRKGELNGKDTLYFSGGVQGVVEGDGFTGNYGGNSKASHGAQISNLPGGESDDYVDEHAAWACFVVFRAATTDKKMALLGGLSNQANASINDEFGLFCNTAQGAAGAYPNATSVTEGNLIFYDSKFASFSEAGSGTGGQPRKGAWDESASNMCVASILFDAGMDVGSSTTAGFRSLLRVNGQPIDRWGSPSGETAGASAQLWPEVGFDIAFHNVSAALFGDVERFAGDIMELIVMRYNPEGGAKQSPIDGPPYPDIAQVPLGDSELERMEGYLAWRWGIGHELENDNQKGGGVETGYVHPFGPGDLNGPPSPKGRFATASQAAPEDVAKLLGPYAVLSKWTAGGSLQWAYSEQGAGGVGSGLALTEDGVWSVGPWSLDASAAQYWSIRTFTDKGTYYREFDDPIINFPLGTYQFKNTHVDIQSDPWFNCWIPVDDPLHDVLPVQNLPKATVWGIAPDITTHKIISIPGDTPPPGASVWVPSTKLEYGDEGLEWPERVYVATRLEQTATIKIAPTLVSGNNFDVDDAVYTAKALPVNPGEFVLEANDQDQADIIYAAINADPAFKDGRIAYSTYPNQQVEAIARGVDAGSGRETVTVKALYAGAKTINLGGTLNQIEWLGGITQLLLTENEYACNNVQILDSNLGAAASPRVVTTLAVAGGYVKVVDGVDAVAPAGTDSIVQTSTPALDPNGIPFGVVLFGKVYFADGKNLLRYTAKTDVLEVFKPDESGAPPKRVVLLEQWRTRLVAVTSDDRWNYYMSAVGEPDNWDFFPAILDADQATFGNHPNGAGRVPDIINGFVPISDDLALFLCDSSVHRMTGDPMRGGQIDQVNRASGGAFGRAWVVGPTGMVFYYGSRGGVFALNPSSGAAERISHYRIEKQTQNVDLALYRPRLEWDYERDGLMVSMVPYGAGGTMAKHWFWDAKNDRWSPFEYGTAGATGVQPTALQVIDGDGVADRSLLLGCEDGYIRYVDSAAYDDDGVAIDSRVLIGPLVGPDVDLDARYSNLVAVLGAQHAGCTAEWYHSDNWEDEGSPRSRRLLKAGRNAPLFDSVRGPALWLGLRNASPGQRWSMESLYLDVQAASEARGRP